MKSSSWALGSWLLLAPLVALPLACSDESPGTGGGTPAGASAGKAGSAGRAGTAGSEQGGEGGEGRANAGRPGDVGGEAGDGQGVGGTGGNGAVGGSSGGRGGRGGRGGGAGTMSDGGTVSTGGTVSAEGGAAAAAGEMGEGGAAAAAGEMGEGGAAAVGGSLGVGGGGGTAGDVGGTAGTAGDSASGGTGAGGTAGTSSAGTAGTGGAPPECVEASDCDAARGASPCGVWTCTGEGKCRAESPGCTDADGDGYGVGAGCECAELDCNDRTAAIGGRLAVGEACYTGSPSTRGVGICREGVRYCRGDVCAGEVTPAREACNTEDDDCDGAADEDFGVFTCGVGACATSTPACVAGRVGACSYDSQTGTDGCNGVDDDCDGGIDEDCPSNCVRVALTGDDTAAAASNGTTPFRNVQPAIDFAYATPSAPKHVCIAAGASCANGTTATYAGPSGTPLTMRNGVHVTGRYESTSWTSCSTNVATVLQPTTSEGLLFPPSIVDRTIAFRLNVERAVFATSAAVTVDGSKNVLLASVYTGGPSGTTNSYGVNIVNGAEVHLYSSRAYGGAASVESIGLRVVGARALLEDSSANAGGGSTLGTAIGVLFDSAPGSRITTTGVYASGGGTRSEAFGVVVIGDSRGVVIGHSTVTSFHPRARDSYGAAGVAAYDCGDSTPWITRNAVTSNGRFGDDGYSYGIHADACSPSIDQNWSIRAFRDGTLSAGLADDYRAYGIRCQNGLPGCTVAGNASISGDTWGSGTVVNVAGGARISRNTILGRLRSSELPAGAVNCESSGCGRKVVGIAGGGYIDFNDVIAGCSLRSTGISGGNYVRGNKVEGHTIDDCVRSGPGTNDPRIPASTGEIGVSGGLYYENNSVIIASAGPGNIESGTYQAATASGYVYLNNGFAIWEDMGTVFFEGRTPARFERNVLTGAGGSYYYDAETATTLTTAAQINALSDMISIGNTVKP